METGVSPARIARAKHRHEIHTLTYVTLNDANGGIVRNLSHEGIGVQAVAALRPLQQLRVRFELRHPRLRVETQGEVTWATSSGQCGIRFLDLSPRMTRQINEWIFGNLLGGASLNAERSGLRFGGTSTALTVPTAPGEEDGLIISGGPLTIIDLPTRPRTLRSVHTHADDSAPQKATAWEWLFQPLTGSRLVWTINSLVMMAATLLFVLIFLFITRELPRWPLGAVCGATILVGALYWGFFQLFGGASPGARLALLAGDDLERDEKTSRFR